MEGSQVVGLSGPKVNREESSISRLLVPGQVPSPEHHNISMGSSEVNPCPGLDTLCPGHPLPWTPIALDTPGSLPYILSPVSPNAIPVSSRIGTSM